MSGSGWVDDAHAFSESDEEESVTTVEITPINHTSKTLGSLTVKAKMEAKEKRQVKMHSLSAMEVSGAEVANKCRALKSTAFYAKQAEIRQVQRQAPAIKKVSTSKKLQDKLDSLKAQKSAFRFSWHPSQQQKFKKMAQAHGKSVAGSASGSGGSSSDEGEKKTPKPHDS